LTDILIDNATISSSFRALGYVPIAKKELLDVDQAALERLTEAMLLGDSVVVPDNYQEQFRDERKRILHHDCFRHVPVTNEVKGNLEIISTETCKLWRDAYKEGASKGSLARYFELADSYFSNVWQGTRESASYLVTGYLGVGKDNPLIRAFVEKDYGDFALKVFGDFSEQLEVDLERSRNPPGWSIDAHQNFESSNRNIRRGPTEWRIDSEGELYRHDDPDDSDDPDDRGFDDSDDDDNLWESVDARFIANDLKRLVSTLAWLGKQYAWYQTLSAQLGAHYLSHPLRDFFAEDFLGELEVKPEGAEYGGVVRRGLRQFRENSQRALEEIGLGSSLVKVNLPMFLPLAIQRSSTGKDFLDTVSQLRSEPACVELREMLNEVDTALSEGDLKPYRRLQQEIEKIGTNLLRERGIESAQIKLSPPWKLIGVTPADAGVAFPTDALSLNLALPSALYKQFFVRRRYRVILKNIMEELALIPTLAKYKDKLNSYSRSK
jgi:hypothetical protein